MWVGFHDDPVLRFDGGRAEAFDRAAADGASIVRTLVEWPRVAPLKPANPSDPFDPAYKFDDLDEFVRSAQARGIEVLITLWGTPGWANGNQRPQLLPTKATDFQNFARAVASRYSGQVRRVPVRPLLRDLERVEPRDVPEPAVRHQRQHRQPAELREDRRRRLCGHQGRQQVRAGRDRRDLVERPRQDRPRPDRHRAPRDLHEAPREGEPAAEVRRLGAAPVPVPGEPGARRRRRSTRTSRSRRCRRSRRISTSRSSGRTSPCGSPSTATRRAR